MHYIYDPSFPIDDKIDAVFEDFSEAFERGMFGEIDRFLCDVMLGSLDSTVIVALLTASSWAKDRLPNRQEFVFRCRQRLLLEKDRETVDRLVSGLE